jgi:alcohol dehydrogenase class IV
VVHSFAARAAEPGLPATLAAIGVKHEMLPAIAAAAPKDHCHVSNPREASQADYRALLEAAYDA